MLNTKFQLTKQDLNFIKDKIINPQNGHPYSIYLIQQVFYGKRKNMLIHQFLTKYFTETKKEMESLVKVSDPTQI
jgi:hypothetical protein